MKSVSVVQVALLFLVLILSHEGITTAEKIRESIHLRHRIRKGTKHRNHHHHHHHKHKRARLRKREGKVAETGNQWTAHDSFLEANAVQGMSVEAMGTMEINGLHKSLYDHYRFRNSPIAEDVDKLVAIPAGAILSRSELHQRRDHIIVLLEKAHTHAMVTKSPGASAIKDQKAVDESLTVTGGIGAAIFGFIQGYNSGMASELKGMLEDPKCSSEDSISDLKDKMKSVGHSFKGVYGNLTQLHRKWGPQGRGEVFGAMKHFGRSMVIFARAAGLYVWNCPGAKMLAQQLLTMMVTFIQQLLITTIDAMTGGAATIAQKSIQRAHQLADKANNAVAAVKNASDTAKKMIEDGVNSVAKEGLKTVANSGIDVANNAIAANGMGAYLAGASKAFPILAKYSGILVSLLSSSYYFGVKGYHVCADARKMLNRTCDTGCKTHMIENSFGMAGIFTDVIINSGIDQMLQVGRDKSKPFFESFSIEYTDSFTDDMSKLNDAAKTCKKGGSFKIPKFESSISSMMPAGHDKEFEEQKANAWAKYEKACKAKKNGCWPKERWEGSYDLLQGECMKKYKKDLRVWKNQGGTKPEWNNYKNKCAKKTGSVGVQLSPIPFPSISFSFGNNQNKIPDAKDEIGNTTTKRPWLEPKTMDEVIKNVDRSQVEATMEKEIYYRVRKSTITMEWRKYLLTTRLHGDHPMCFRKWLNRWNGHPEGFCLHEEPVHPNATTTEMPTEEPLIGELTTAASPDNVIVTTQAPTTSASTTEMKKETPASTTPSSTTEMKKETPASTTPAIEVTTKPEDIPIDLVDDDDDDDDIIPARSFSRASSRSSSYSRSRSATVQDAAAESEMKKEDEEDDMA